MCFAEILPTAYEGDKFPGYENVRLSYYQLEGIINRKRFSWIYALKNQKAVYLITDKKKGMLLQRWSDYVRDGYGGNTRLKEHVKEKASTILKIIFGIQFWKTITQEYMISMFWTGKHGGKKL